MHGHRLLPQHYPLTAAAPKLSVSPGSMRFSTQNPAQVLTVRNAEGGGPLNFTATITGNNSFFLLLWFISCQEIQFIIPVFLLAVICANCMRPRREFLPKIVPRASALFWNASTLS